MSGKSVATCHRMKKASCKGHIPAEVREAPGIWVYWCKDSMCWSNQPCEHLKKPRFKDPILNQVYEGFVSLNDEQFEKVLVTEGALQIAFRRGTNSEPLVGVHNYDKTSPAYAAYCAGKERAK